jgi:hypothetical protein
MNRQARTNLKEMDQVLNLGIDKQWYEAGP